MILHDVTPDGRYLHLLMTNAGTAGEYRIDLNAATPRTPQLLIADSPQLRIGLQVHLTPDGRRLFTGPRDGPVAVVPYPLNSGAPVQYLTNKMRFPFFSKDGRSMYGTATDLAGAPLSVQAILSDGAGLRLGPPTALFPIQRPTRVGAISGAVSRDGSRILAIAAEASEELKMQVLTDWTTLLPGRR